MWQRQPSSKVLHPDFVGATIAFGRSKVCQSLYTTVVSVRAERPGQGVLFVPRSQSYVAQKILVRRVYFYLGVRI